MGRIIEVNEELQKLHSSEEKIYQYSDADETTIKQASLATAAVTLPSNEEVETLLDDLQQAVEVWLIPGGKEMGGAEAEFVYDDSWG